MHKSEIPTVLCFSGHDPSGGAGIQADIETVASMGCHALPVITSLTVQDTKNVHQFQPVNVSLFIEQARCVLENISVSAIKIGMTGSQTIIEAIHSILRDFPDIPVVFDPVLRAGGGASLGEDEVVDAIRNLLLPVTTVLTPNSLEARKLIPEADTLNACGQALLDSGCEFTLITGTHEQAEHVDNQWFGNHRLLETFTWERLPEEYHGSGCTLASAMAALIGHGLDPFQAAHEAQEYTWQALKHAFRISPGGQLIPNRLFWAQNVEE